MESAQKKLLKYTEGGQVVDPAVLQSNMDIKHAYSVGLECDQLITTSHSGTNDASFCPHSYC